MTLDVSPGCFNSLQVKIRIPSMDACVSKGRKRLKERHAYLGNLSWISNWLWAHLSTRHAQLAWAQFATPNMENAPLHLMIIKLESCSGKIMENPCVLMLAMRCSTGLPKLCSTLILRHLGRRLKNQMECGVVTYTASTWPKLSWRVVS